MLSLFGKAGRETIVRFASMEPRQQVRGNLGAPTPRGGPDNGPPVGCGNRCPLLPSGYRWVGNPDIASEFSIGGPCREYVNYILHTIYMLYAYLPYKTMQ
jgi:hypothetical protein